MVPFRVSWGGKDEQQKFYKYFWVDAKSWEVLVWFWYLTTQSLSIHVFLSPAMFTNLTLHPLPYFSNYPRLPSMLIPLAWPCLHPLNWHLCFSILPSLSLTPSLHSSLLCFTIPLPLPSSYLSLSPSPSLHPSTSQHVPISHTSYIIIFHLSLTLHSSTLAYFHSTSLLHPSPPNHTHSGWVMGTVRMRSGGMSNHSGSCPLAESTRGSTSHLPPLPRHPNLWHTCNEMLIRVVLGDLGIDLHVFFVMVVVVVVRKSRIRW